MFGGWSDGSVGKALIPKAWGPKFSPQRQYKKLDAVVRNCNPSPREADTGGSRAHCPVSPANFGKCQARLVGDPVSKHSFVHPVRKTTSVVFWLHIGMNMHTRHTYTNILMNLEHAEAMPPPLWKTES